MRLAKLSFLLIICLVPSQCDPSPALSDEVTTTDDSIHEVIISNDLSEDLSEEEDEDVVTNKGEEKDDISSEDDIIDDDDILDEELMEHVHDGVYHETLDLELGDEERDGQLLVDVIASIAEWKDRQQRKLLHYLFHRQKRDEEVVCYGELGCFRDEGPFNYLDMLPSPPAEIGTEFFLFTRRNDETPQMLDYLNTTSISASNFNVSLPTKVIIHGFGSSCHKIWPREMRLSFLLVEDCNVICVDWAAGAVDPNYVRAAVNTRLVGKQVAALIRAINEDVGVAINNNTHLVGFSLGAHVSGFVGKEMKNLSRITGLDPAGPLFEGYTPNVRLDKTDADFVDVIHSNGDSLIIGGLGAWEPIGHVDFYPNGGKAQRGCQNLLIGGLYDFIYSYSTKNESYRYLCNHRRAYKLFTDSISPKCKFTAFPCESYEKFESGQCFSCGEENGECGQLGYRSNLSPGRGSLYLLTREDEPFCAAQFKIKMMFTGSRLPIYTYGALQVKLINKEGINETFTLTSTHDELLTSGAKIEKLIVSHPALSEPTEIQILYVAYEGWIYSGRDVWSVEKLSLSDGLGNVRTWCKDHGELLPKNVPINIPLSLGECSNTSPGTLGTDKLVTGDQSSPPVLPSQGLLPPAPPLSSSDSPTKTSNIRPPLVTNDIRKNSDILEHNLLVSDSLPPESVPPFTSEQAAQYNLNTMPRPVLLPVKPHQTMLPVKQSHQVPVFGKPDGHHQWNNKYIYNPRPPIQPFHLQGPPGVWNIVTSKPGSLPPPIHVYQSKLPQLNTQGAEGVEIQLGPRLPLPPLNSGLKVQRPFPPRRRPSTPMQGPVMSSPDMSASETSVLLTSSTEIHVPATERVDEISEDDIIVIETNQLKNDTGENSGVNGTGDGIKTDILSDDKVTIFKVGPDNDIVRVSNETGENDTDTDSKDDYKFFILHKLPNGNAVNLENLKTYNYEDLIKGHSSVIEDANQQISEEGNFDRENPEFFDVPRRVIDDRKSPYIIYQLSDKQADSHNHHVTSSPGGQGYQPVYNRPNVFPVYKPDPLKTVQSVQQGSENNPGMTTLLASTTTDNIANVAIVTDGTSSNLNRTLDTDTAEWIPRNRTDISLGKLSELSQLAQVSINNKGPLKIQSHKGTSAFPPKLNVQLLPPRLSAVLSHLDTAYRERDRTVNLDRDNRHGNSRYVISPHRQNKVSPAFKSIIKPTRERERGYGRRIHSGEYHVTKPYQSQVIPSTKHRYIPLLHEQKKPLWWHPEDSNYQFPLRPHQVLTNPHSYSMVSKPFVGSPFKNIPPLTRPEGTETRKPPISLRNTQPPLLFNKKQSVLLGMNQAVKRPIHIKARNKTLTVKPPLQNITNFDEIRLKHLKSYDRKSLLNSTTSNQEFSTNNHNNTQTSEVFPRDHSEDSLLMNLDDRVTIPFSTANNVNIKENVSRENVTINQENPHLQVDHVKVKELSENHESSLNPVSGRS